MYPLAWRTPSAVRNAVHAPTTAMQVQEMAKYARVQKFVRENVPRGRRALNARKGARARYGVAVTNKGINKVVYVGEHAVCSRSPVTRRQTAYDGVRTLKAIPRSGRRRGCW